MDKKKYVRVDPFTGFPEKDVKEDVPTTSTAGVAATGDDPTVVVRKKKKKLYDGRTSIAKKFVERILKQREARRVAEEVELEEKVKQPRQLINPSKEVMVVKNNKVIVVDKKDLKQYTSKGWSLAEDVELDEMRGIYVVRNHNGRMIAKNKNRNAIDKERKKYETQTGNKTTMNIEKEPVPDLKEEVEEDFRGYGKHFALTLTPTLRKKVMKLLDKEKIEYDKFSRKFLFIGKDGGKLLYL